MGGEYHEHSENFAEVTDKYTQKTITTISLANEEDTEHAALAAQEAFHIMRGTSAEERWECLKNLELLLLQNKDALTELICKESGKPIKYAALEVKRAIFATGWAAEEARRFCGENLPFDMGIGKGKIALTAYYPRGPILAFSPFNFPLNLALHKILPALAIGTSVVLKPSPYTPLTALALAELVAKAGFAKNALQVITCNNLTAEKMLKNNIFKVFSFTGSDKIGWLLKEKIPEKKCILELGGIAPVIIDSIETESLENIASQVAESAFAYAGQVCIAAQRIIVTDSVFDMFEKILIKMTNSIVSGNPTDSNTQNAPVISKEHLERIHHIVRDAINKGATLVCGGNIADSKHNIYMPTLLKNVTPEMRIMQEEVFGPVATLEKASDYKNALIMANHNKYGLQTGVFTDNINNIKLAFNILETGTVVINQSPTFRLDHMPYGGIKLSGEGKEGILYAMKEYCESKLLIF